MSKKLKRQDGEKMADGTTAWLTASGNYFCRREPNFENWTGIAYYTLTTKERIGLAKGQCNKCLEVIESKMCGDFQRCKCGASFVDTTRMTPEIHRYGGDITIL